MEKSSTLGSKDPNSVSGLYRKAILLSQITIFYNLCEGAISVFFGMADETLSLFGFGIDSFVEVVSGIGVWNMIHRQRHNPDADPGYFEKRALRITGTAFYLLAVGLVVSAVLNLYHGHRPETTFWGIVIAAVSILTMWLLVYFKVEVGRPWFAFVTRFIAIWCSWVGSAMTVPQSFCVNENRFRPLIRKTALPNTR